MIIQIIIFVSMSFINRISELTFLEEEYKRNKSSFVVVYGRRRSGKTTLIRRFISDKKHSIFFLADKTNELSLINLFKDRIAKYVAKPYLQTLTLQTWDQVFGLLIENMPANEKLVLVLDEFQYLAQVNQSFPSILQRIWDTELMEKNIMLIICGSSVSMMLSVALNYNAPLYGRRTGQIALDKIKFSDFSGFFPTVKSCIELVQLYAITGGIPKYIEFFTEDKPLFEQIAKTYFRKEHFLYNEAKFLLIEEIKEPINYFAILKSIAGGERTLAGICNKLQVASGKVTPYLDVLKEIRLIERRVPITETVPNKSKKGLYYINDAYLRFWFRYVFPRQAEIELEETNTLLIELEKDFQQFIGFEFEEICRQILPLLYPGYNKTGSWWDKHAEIDIVAINYEKSKVLIGECKWNNQLIGSNVLNNLIKKAVHIDWGIDKPEIKYVLFAKNGFRKELLENRRQDVDLIDFKTLVL